MTSEQPSLEQLLDALANMEFFVIFMEPTDTFDVTFASDEARQILTEHLLYLSEIQRANQLYASGPIDGDGAGMAIVRTEAREDAERIAYAEPFHKAGWRTNTVRSWQLNEGLLVERATELTNSSEPHRAVRPDTLATRSDEEIHSARPRVVHRGVGPS